MPIATSALCSSLLCHFLSSHWHKFLRAKMFRLSPMVPNNSYPLERVVRQSSNNLCWLSESQSDDCLLRQSHITINFADLYIAFSFARSKEFIDSHRQKIRSECEACSRLLKICQQVHQFNLFRNNLMIKTYFKVIINICGIRLRQTLTYLIT